MNNEIGLAAVLLALLGIMGGFTGGVAWTQCGVRKLLRIHDKEIAVNSEAIETLKEEVGDMKSDYRKKLDRCLELHMETLQAVTANTNVNAQVIIQNNLLLKQITKVS